MPEFRDYKRYVTDENWASIYTSYQKKYATEPRESDKKILELVKRARQDIPEHKHIRLLDIGCSTGNLLRLLSTAGVGTCLVGGDLMKEAIAEAGRDEWMKGRVTFMEMDVFDIPTAEPYNIIIANALNVYFEPDEYERAVQSISRAMPFGGVFIAYEWIFPDDREQRIIEKSHGHPEGLKFWLRSNTFVRDVLKRCGFRHIYIEQFDIPIDLPKPVPDGTDADLMTYTVKDPNTGKRTMYRGALYQPWAHIYAVK